MLYQFQPEELGDDELIDLLNEWSELVYAINSMQAQTYEWWMDDETGMKADTWEEMKKNYISLLDTFPFLIHCHSSHGLKWRH